MKKIEAIIRHYKLEEVKTSLLEADIRSMTASEVRGSGRPRTGDHPHTVDFLPKLKIELVVKDDQVQQAIELISKAARTGKVGDGKIFVLPVEQVVRIRTGETGDEAV